MIKYFFFGLFLFSTQIYGDVLPSLKTRARLFDEYIQNIERLDGDGLIPRKNRPLPWKKTISLLRIKLLKAQTKIQFAKVFIQIDNTYTNLHSHLKLAPEFDLRAQEGSVQLPF